MGCAASKGTDVKQSEPGGDIATAVGPLADPAAAAADDDEAPSKWNPKNHGSLRNFEHKAAEFVRKEEHKLVEHAKHSLMHIEKALDKVNFDQIDAIFEAHQSKDAVVLLDGGVSLKDDRRAVMWAAGAPVAAPSS